MANVIVMRAWRVGGTDVVRCEGSVDGQPVQATVWWSHLAPLSAAQRRAAVAQALADVAGPAPTDLGISGTVIV